MTAFRSYPRPPFCTIGGSYCFCRTQRTEIKKDERSILSCREDLLSDVPFRKYSGPIIHFHITVVVSYALDKNV